MTDLGFDIQANGARGARLPPEFIDRVRTDRKDGGEAVTAWRAPSSRRVRGLRAFVDLARNSRRDDMRGVDLVREWGQRIAADARSSLQLAEQLPGFRGVVEERLDAILRHYGADDPTHAFHVEPHWWLRLTEVQATKGLADFLRRGGEARALAFLRALDPGIAWPAALSKVEVRAEDPVSGGRIDLWVCGQSGSAKWGAVVEAKFGHHARDNPLASYRRTAIASGMLVSATQTSMPTSVLRIVGQRRCGSTSSRLAFNRDWDFVSWTALLRRLERELRGLPGDDDFRRFRRTLWERAR